MNAHENGRLRGRLESTRRTERPEASQDAQEGPQDARNGAGPTTIPPSGELTQETASRGAWPAMGDLRDCTDHADDLKEIDMHDPLTQEELEHLLQLDEAATPAPWGYTAGYTAPNDEVVKYPDLIAGGRTLDVDTLSHDDLLLIVAARSAVGPLAREVLELRRALVELRGGPHDHAH